MADVILTPQTFDRTGLDPTFGAVIDTDRYLFRNSKDTELRVNNGSGGVCVVTLETAPSAPGGLAIENPTVSIPAGEERTIALSPVTSFNDGNGRAAFTQDVAASVTAAVVQRKAE